MIAMILKHSKFYLAALLASFAISGTTNAQDEPVNFGDSGIVVVVEQEGEDDGDGSGWAYWFYDEFLHFYPKWNWIPAVPNFPIWDGGDGGDSDTPCTDAQEALDAAQAAYDEVNDAYAEAVEGGPLEYKGKLYKQGTSGWVNAFYRLSAERDELLQARDEAQENADVACGS